MSIARKIGAAAAASVAMAGLSLAAATPAEASIPPAGVYASIVTPHNSMPCNLSVYPRTVAGVTEYEGGAICNASLKFRPWRVKVNCTNGLNYYSGTFEPTPFDWVRYLTPPILCFWGVNSVEVIEY